MFPRNYSPGGWTGSFPAFTSAQRCVFPFRYGNILYYGCAQLEAGTYPNYPGGRARWSLCATEIDSDYNALKMGHCNDYCHIQV